MKHVHLIGIGGSGLSAIAQVLLERGYTVSGSDRQDSPVVQRLQQAGAQVFIGHRPENLQGADLVLRSSAIPDENPEVQAARQSGLPVLKRVDFLGHLMGDQKCLAVAGTHGKTTTTAMLAWMLSAQGQDPSYVIGGVSANLGGSAHAGKGPYFVIEADEYDGMFWGLRPFIAVVTNIEHDHPDCYPTPQEFYQAFRKFSSGLQPDGMLLCCADDPGAASLLADQRGSRRALAYGLDTALSDYRATNLAPLPSGGLGFDFITPASGVTPVTLQVPGLHNVRNALAALAVVDLLGLSLRPAAQALSAYRGTGRRFEVRGQAAGVTLIDDYAHHPTEIRATLSAARQRFPGCRLWAVWQPHTYSRTRALFNEFAAAFDEADQVLVTDIYPARESPPPDGFSASQVVAAMLSRNTVPVTFTPALAETSAYLRAQLQPGDVVLVLSAGDADQVNAHLLRVLENPEGLQDPQGLGYRSDQEI